MNKPPPPERILPIVRFILTNYCIGFWIFNDLSGDNIGLLKEIVLLGVCVYWGEGVVPQFLPPINKVIHRWDKLSCRNQTSLRESY